MNLPNFETWSFKMQTRKYLSKHYPDFLQHIDEKYNYIESLKEKIYLYIHNMEYPNKCKVCGQYTKYINSTKGYSTYCSSKCCNSDQDKKNKTKLNNLAKYGVENISQLESVKEKKKQTSMNNWGVENPILSERVQKKVKKSMMDRYGVEYPSQSPEIQLKYQNTMMVKYGVLHPSQLESVKEKKKQTSMNNWGVEHPSQSDEIKEKKKQTSMDNWGTSTPMMNKIIKDKVKNSFNKTYMSKHPDIKNILEINGERIYVCCCTDTSCNSCQEKQYRINHSLYHSRNGQNIEKCTIKNPIDHKSKDTSIELFVHDILDNYNIPYITNTRVINNQELDIFIPSKNIGIECNGIYWHSDKIKMPRYHYNKYMNHIKNGIEMITIWEDWIKTKPEIIKSIILSKLDLYDKQISDENLNVNELSRNVCDKFLEQNHVMGKVKSSVRLGLYMGQELVSVMCFRKINQYRKSNENIYHNDVEWELVRFCNLLNTRIDISHSKLLNYFIENYNPEKIVVFSPHDISDKKIYEDSGFVKQYDIMGTYWYVDERSQTRHHRYEFRKSKLVKDGYDPNLSEFEIMNNLPYMRIYDSGQDKYIWTKKERF